MKIFTFLFSVYLLTLACLPCADREECNAATEHKIVASANHSEHSHDMESCTPFCICNCCGAQVVQVIKPVIYTTQLLFVANRQKPIAYHQPIATRACHNIWQPPRLG